MITRRTVLTGSMASAVITLPAAATAPDRHPVKRRPNILVLVTDDHPLGCESGLPHLTAHMGRHGVAFSRAYANTPLCAPSRATILTGRYAHNHGVRSNRFVANFAHRRAAPHHLQAAGYRTGLVGKFFNNWDAAEAPPYFDEYAMMADPGYNGAVWSVDGRRGKVPGYTTTIVRNQAVDFLRRSDDRPWFLYVAPYAPHAPYRAEEKYADAEFPAWDARPSAKSPDRTGKPPFIQASEGTLAQGRRLRTRQLRTLRSVDDLFAALVAELRSSGQLSNTLIVVVSDNGFCWGDHGWLRKSVPYMPAVRVPMYLSWPAGGLTGGRTDPRLAATIDVAPTILDAAGIPFASDGRSLLRTWRRDQVLTEWWNGRERPTNPPTWASLITQGWQYTEYYDTYLDRQGRPSEGTREVSFREYYDLRTDPYQRVNLLHGNTGRFDVAALSARLRAVRQ